MPTSLCTPCCRLFGFELCIADCVVVFTSLHFSSQDKSEFLTRNLIRHMLIQAQQLSDEQKVCVWGTTDNRFRLWQGQCQVPNAKCAMPNAKCQMPNAQMFKCQMLKCQMPNAKCSNAQMLKCQMLKCHLTKRTDGCRR